MPQKLSFCVNRCTASLAFILSHWTGKIQHPNVVTGAGCERGGWPQLEMFSYKPCCRFTMVAEAKCCSRQPPAFPWCPPSPSAACCLALHFQKNSLWISSESSLVPERSTSTVWASAKDSVGAARDPPVFCPGLLHPTEGCKKIPYFSTQT